MPALPSAASNSLFGSLPSVCRASPPTWPYTRSLYGNLDMVFAGTYDLRIAKGPKLVAIAHGWNPRQIPSAREARIVAAHENLHAATSLISWQLPTFTASIR